MTDKASKYDAIFLIGPQGSGKGTQGRLLAERLGFFYWEMGGILREEAKKDTPFGRKVKGLIDEGLLLEDNELLRILNMELPEVTTHQRIVFDGVPRRVGQGVHLISYLHREGFTKLATIFIDVPLDESVKRLTERAHHEFRVDDTPDKIRRRLQIYQSDTLPVLDFLKTLSDFYNIDGMGSVEDVTNRINEALEI